MRLYNRLPAQRPIEQYDMIEGRGVEPEVGALLYGLVRCLKPRRCVETGLHVGDSAEWIGRALQDNGHGWLTTCDTDHEKIGPGRERLGHLPVEVVECNGAELLRIKILEGPLDFVHIDSGDPTTVRIEELWLCDDKSISPGGFVCYHDATASAAPNYVKFSEVRNWPHVIVPSYVGVAIFHRPE